MIETTKSNKIYISILVLFLLNSTCLASPPPEVVTNNEPPRNIKTTVTADNLREEVELKIKNLDSRINYATSQENEMAASQFNVPIDELKNRTLKLKEIEAVYKRQLIS